jgi:hypothetical protein
VLLARLQRHAQRGLAGRVPRHADDAAGHGAQVSRARRHESGMRPAVARLHAEALCRSDGDIRPELARRRENEQRKRIDPHGHQAACGMHAGDQLARVADAAVSIGILDMAAEHACRVQRAPRVADLQFDSGPLGARANHGADLRMAGVVEKKHLRGIRARAAHQRHRLGRRGGFIQERGVGHRQAGEIDRHLLEGEKRLQAALRDLGLVGRVRGVPAGVLEHVALDYRGRVAVVTAHPDEAAPPLVGCGEPLEVGERLRLLRAAR